VWKRVTAAVVAGIAVAALTVAAVWLVPPWLMTGPYAEVSTTLGGLSISDILKSATDLRHSIIETLQVIATAVTAIVLVFTLYYTAKNVSLAEKNSQLSLDAQRQARIGERFSKATEQLSNTSEPVRVGAVYALARIAQESEEDYWPVVELLCAFLRSKRPVGSQRATGPVAPPEDIKAIAVFLRTRDHQREVAGQTINLSRTNLHALDLSGVHLVGAILDGAELDGAQLNEAHLRGAKLSSALATDADFTDADLEGSFLNGATLTRARLTGANLRDAMLTGAKANPVIGPAKNLTQAQKDSVDGTWYETV
jgi:Pentapeptide repeats (8 copies)